jgi:hypothetical protein
MKHMNRHYFPHLLAGALALACMNPAIAYEPTSHYTEKEMHGWNVFVNNALLPGGEKAETGAAAIKQLDRDLAKIKSCLADKPLNKLLKVGIWLEVDTTNGPHGRTPVFHYHPFLGWLETMDFHPGKHKCVELSRADALVKSGRSGRSAHILLHELAHAYHDQVLSLDNPDILAAHKRARENGKYPRRDRGVRANHKEFFAGVSTRYFSTREERDALAERDPVLLKKLQEFWGTPKGYIQAPPNAAERSKELQVLNGWVGTWKQDVTIKTTGQKNSGIITRKWSSNGKFLLSEGVENGDEFHFLMTYDMKAQVYRTVFISASQVTEIIGTWDNASSTMTWDGGDQEIRLSGSYRLVDRNNAEWSLKAINRAGEVVHDQAGKLRRME